VAKREGVTLTVLNDADGTVVLAAAPIFITDDKVKPREDAIIFEVRESDLHALSSFVGELENFFINSSRQCLALLESLEPCTSSHEGLSEERDQTVLRGVLKVFMESRPQSASEI